MSFEQWLQSRLTAHGFPCGDIDGDIGPTTVKAIRAFQKAKGLTVSGTGSAETVAALRASSTAGIPPISDREIITKTVKPSGLQANAWPQQKDMIAYYGAVGTRQVSIEVPFAMVLAWDSSTKFKKMTLHEKCAPSALRVLTKIADIYTERERAQLGINLFAGSLNVRKMRGGTSYSIHSWGAAIDFDSLRNGLNTHSPAARLSHADAVPFWQAWEAESWLSLGRAKNYDWMHVQAARL